MDEIDFKLVEMLGKDSRETFRNIAKELGVTTDTVSRRYKKLKERGAIKASIVVDIGILGYRAHVWYWISLSSQTHLSGIKEKLLKIPDVIAFHKAMGDYDLLVVAAVRDFDHLRKIDVQIADIKGISRIESAHYLLEGILFQFPLPPLKALLEK